MLWGARSVMAEVALLVGEEEAPEVYKLTEEDSVEVGPFAVRLGCTLALPPPGCLAGWVPCMRREGL